MSDTRRDSVESFHFSGSLAPHVPSPLFSKSYARLEKSMKEKEKERGSLKAPLHQQTVENLKLKIFQLELSDKEACKFILAQCEVLLDVLGSNGDEVRYQQLEFSDIRSGLAQLASLQSRLAIMRTTLGRNLKDLSERHETQITRFQHQMSFLESCNKKLEDENQSFRLMQDTIDLSFEKINKDWEKKFHTVRDLLTKEREEKELLTKKNDELEEKVMTIPRLEEQHHRQAKQIAKKSDEAIKMVEVQLIKKNEEFQELDYYKQQVPNLENLVIKQSKEIRQLKEEVKVYSNKYFSILKTTSLRPRTADSSAPTSNKNTNKVTHSTAPVPAVERPSRPRAKSTPSEVEDFIGKSLESQHENEIKRLRAIVQERDAQIQRLSRSLSHARAYPLLGMQPDKAGPAEFDNKGVGLLQSQLRFLTPKINLKDYFADLEGSLYDGKEFESDSVNFLQHEDMLQGQRESDAVATQKDYLYTRAMRNAKSPHITAIRQSLSFSMSD